MLRQCEARVLSVCLFFARGDRDRFRDLYQEVARVLWEEWPHFRGESSLETWATSIALHTAALDWRSRSRGPDFVSLDERFYDIAVDEPTDDRYRTLYLLIDRLDSATDRQLLYLYIDRVPLADIATRMGTSTAAIKERIYRIKKKLIALKEKYSDEIETL